MAYESLTDLNLYSLGSLDFTADVKLIQPEGTRVRVRQPTWDWARTTGSILGDNITLKHEYITHPKVTMSFDDYDSNLHNTDITVTDGSVKIKGLNSKEDWEGASLYLDVPTDWHGIIEFTSTARNEETGIQLQWGTQVEWTDEPELHRPDTLYYKYYDEYDRQWSIDFWTYWQPKDRDSTSIPSYPVTLESHSDWQNTVEASSWDQVVAYYESGYFYRGFDEYIFDFRNPKQPYEQQKNHNTKLFMVFNHGPNNRSHYRIEYTMYNAATSVFNRYLWIQDWVNDLNNNWHHWLLTHKVNPVTNNTEWAFYRDGVPYYLGTDSIRAPATIGPNLTLGQSVALRPIGGLGPLLDGGPRYYNGYLEDFRIKKRAFNSYFDIDTWGRQFTPPQKKTIPSQGDVILLNPPDNVDLTIQDNNADDRRPVTISEINGSSEYNTTNSKYAPNLHFGTQSQPLLSDIEIDDIQYESNNSIQEGGRTWMWPDYVARVLDEENNCDYELRARTQNANLVFEVSSGLEGTDEDVVQGNNTADITLTGSRENINAYLSTMYFARTGEIEDEADREGKITWELTPQDGRDTITELQDYKPLYNSDITYEDRLYYANDSYTPTQIKNLSYVGVDSQANPVFNYMVVDPAFYNEGRLISTNFKIDYQTGKLSGSKLDVVELGQVPSDGTMNLATIGPRHQINLENTASDTNSARFIVNAGNTDYYEGTVVIDKNQLATTSSEFELIPEESRPHRPVNITQIPVGLSDRWGGPTTYDIDLDTVRLVSGGGGKCYGFDNTRMSIKSPAFYTNENVAIELEFKVRVDQEKPTSQMLVTNRGQGYEPGHFFIEWTSDNKIQWGLQGITPYISDKSYSIGEWHTVKLIATPSGSTSQSWSLWINGVSHGGPRYSGVLNHDTLYFGRLGNGLPLTGAIRDFRWRRGPGPGTDWVTQSHWRNSVADIFVSDFDSIPLAYKEDPWMYEKRVAPTEAYAPYAYEPYKYRVHTEDRFVGATRYQVGDENTAEANISPVKMTLHQNLDSQSTPTGGKKKLLKAVKHHEFDGVNRDDWVIELQAQQINVRENDSDEDNEYQTNIRGNDGSYQFNGKDNYVTVTNTQFNRVAANQFDVDAGNVRVDIRDFQTGGGAYWFRGERVAISSDAIGDENPLVIREDDDFEFEFAIKLERGLDSPQMLMTNRAGSGYNTGDFYIQWTGNTQRIQWGIKGLATQMSDSLEWDQWHHIRFYRSGGGVSLVIDGASQGQRESYSGIINSGYNNPLYLGGLGTNFLYYGLIDRLAIWKNNQRVFNTEFDSIPPRVDDQASSFIMSLQLKLEDTGQNQMLITNRLGTSYLPGNFYLMWVASTRKFQWGMHGHSASTSILSFDYGAQYNIVLEKTGERLELIVNNSSQGSTKSITENIVGDTLTIGLLGDTIPLKGELSELKITDGVQVLTESTFDSYGGEPKLGQEYNFSRDYFNDILGAWGLVYGGSDNRSYMIYTKTNYTDGNRYFADRYSSKGLYYRKISIGDDLTVQVGNEVEIVSQQSSPKFGWKLSCDSIKLGSHLYINIVVADETTGKNAHVYGLKVAYS